MRRMSKLVTKLLLRRDLANCDRSWRVFRDQIALYATNLQFFGMCLRAHSFLHISRTAERIPLETDVVMGQ